MMTGYIRPGKISSSHDYLILKKKTIYFNYIRCDQPSLLTISWIHTTQCDNIWWLPLDYEATDKLSLQSPIKSNWWQSNALNFGSVHESEYADPTLQNDSRISKRTTWTIAASWGGTWGDYKHNRKRNSITRWKRITFCMQAARNYITKWERITFCIQAETDLQNSCHVNN